jgi:N-acetyl-anhydromuramyl-L-alanine amidase AmpD
MKHAFTLSVLVLVSCGVEVPQDIAVADQTSPLDGAFADAAREFQVPVEVLKGIAWVETRITVKNVESASGGVGVMQLSTREDWNKLAEAAQRTGVDQGRLRIDPKANIRGAAAVLRALFDTTNSNGNLDSRETGDWFQAVALYPGFESATLAADYATDIFLALEKGFTSQQPIACNWRTRAPVSSQRRDALGIEYPGAYAWVASPNFSSGRGGTTIDRVLIHTMQGSYAGTRSWFQNSSSNVSSHYIVRSSDGQVTQMVQHADTAWHVQCYNSRSVGIEHEGYVDAPATWYTDAMYTESAKLTAYICDRHGIPKDRTHIIGHYEAPSNCNTGGHTDPGSGWNWTTYMSKVTGTTPTQTTGVFIGAIYTGGVTSNRVAGATVTVGSQSVTTGTDGLYQFSLAPGSYTATVTKSGYSSATVTRTVTANAQIWGSMDIEPQTTATGTLKGVICTGAGAANPHCENSTGTLVSGAVVKVGTATVTTGADGYYEFLTLPVGNVTVSVSKTGYANNSYGRTITAGGTTWGSMNIEPVGGNEPPVVAITFPSDGSQLDLGHVTLTGTVADDGGAISTVKVKLNGGAATDVSVTAGAFSVDVLLKPGTNTIEVSASDAASHTGSATSTVTFNAGIAGLIVLAGDTPTPIDGATVEVREGSSGTVVSTTTSDANGAYAAAVMVVPADYLVTVHKAGYRSLSETVTVPEDQRLAVNFTLTPGDDVATDASLLFVEPKDGATVVSESVTLYGQVNGFDVATVTVNGNAAELVGAGGFSITLKLTKGANTIDATATGVNGQTVANHMTLNYTPNEKKKGCGCSSGVEVFAALAAFVLLRRRARV